MRIGARQFSPHGFWRGLLRWLVLAHRWLGIATCLLFVLWFVSGLVMLYVRLPALTDAERAAHGAPIDWRAVAITPAQALQNAGVRQYSNDLRLQQWLAEPVYRFNAGGVAFAISAADGRRIDNIDAAVAERVARNFSGNANARWQETLERDQWTVTSRFDPYRPLQRIAIPDDRGSELYISATTGEVVLDTTRSERFWNWCGAVTHWFYLTALRTNQRAWESVVLWVSGAGIAVAASGLWLGVQRMRMRHRQRGVSITPYRGWMAWHHIAGLVGGATLLTWIFSGWLSMDPLPLADESALMTLLQAKVAYSDNAGAEFPSTPAMRAALAASDSVEARFSWMTGRPIALLIDRDNRARPFDAVTGKAIVWTDAELFDAMQRLLPAAKLVRRTRLGSEDRYWYSHHEQRTLPVLRGEFDDSSRSWIYLDPATGALLELSNDDLRNHRWWFNALHSCDFPWLLAHRPLWDIVIWTLSLCGLAIAGSGVAIGWRRLRRARQTTRSSSG